MSQLNLGDSLILNSDIVENGAEVKTGATFNGYPVYTKTLKITGSWTSMNNVAVGTISDIRDIVYYTAMGKLNTSTTRIAIPFIYSSGSNTVDEFAEVYNKDGSFLINARRPAGITEVRVTVYYTKTTD